MTTEIKVPLNKVVSRLTFVDEQYTPEQRQRMLRIILNRSGLRTIDIAAMLEVKPQTVRAWSCLVWKTIPYYQLKRLCVLLGFDINNGDPKRNHNWNKTYADVAG